LRKFALMTALCAFLGAGSAQAMSYSVISFQDGSTGILAQGRIEGNESAQLLSALQRSGGAAPRALIISSPGGDMASALDLGQTLRRMRLQTIVGTLAQDAYGQRVVGAGSCNSACVLVFMAGVSRAIMPGSRVGVHSPSVVMVSGGRAYALDDATTRYMVQGTEPALRSYARQMGVHPGLIDMAHRTPHTRLRTLSGSELARYGLVTSGGARKAAHAPKKRAASARRT
jgi:hypothetical protein